MKKIFSDFKSTSAAEWKAQLEKDLKGEPYSSLVWQNENGFDVQPFYNEEDVKTKYYPAFTHGNWLICVNAGSRSESAGNKFLLRNLSRGAEAISFQLTGLDVEKALEAIRLDYISSTFYGNEKDGLNLRNYLAKNPIYNDIFVSFFPQSFETIEDLKSQLKVVEAFKSNINFRSLAVDVYPFHNQNCLAYYEVALAFAMIAEYLEACNGEIPNSQIVVKVGVNADYFVQIAKLRSIRRLWKLFQKEYNITNKLYIIAETSLTTKSISDSYNNLLRSTIESMAAVAGGCNELIVSQFDTLFKIDNEFSERMAVNQQLIIKEEAYLDIMADVSCGSFFVENLTDKIAEKALDAFKSIEKQGGYFEALKLNVIQKEIESQAAVQFEAIKENKRIIIGVNKFRNEQEQPTLSADTLALIMQQAKTYPILNFELNHLPNTKNA